MQVGDLVRVNSKFYGGLLGLVIKHGMDGYFIRSPDHPRVIVAREEDCEVVSEVLL